MSSESVFMSSTVTMRIARRRPSRQPAQKRPLSMPLCERDYSDLSIPTDFSESLPQVVYSSPHDKIECQRKPDLTSSSSSWYKPASYLSVLLGILSLHILYTTHFDTTRTILAIFFSIGFLPFVRPLRWFTKTFIRISLWACFFFLAFGIQTIRYMHHLTTSLIQKSKFKKGTHGITFGTEGKIFVMQSATGVVAFYFLVSGIPFLRIMTLGTEAIDFTFRLLKAVLLLQYYMVLLLGLDLMIYLRVDFILGVMRAAWFRWAIQRVWSVMTWVDIILAMSPSAYYYLHLSLSERSR